MVLFLGLFFTQRYILRTHLRRSLTIALIFMFLLYATLITGDPYDIIGTVQELTVGHKSYRGLSYRDVLFFTSVDILEEHPYGVGWGQSAYYIQRETGQLLSPHNTFMKVAVEGGWSAMVGYGILLLGMLYNCRSALASSFIIAMSLRALFESATPFTLSFVSAMLIVPFFLNELTVEGAPEVTAVPVPTPT